MAVFVFTLWVCAPGDTYYSENYHSGDFQCFGRCSYTSVDRFCQCNSVASVWDLVMELYRGVVKIKGTWFRNEGFSHCVHVCVIIFL